MSEKSKGKSSAAQRRTYHRPQLKRYGSVRLVTLGSPTGTGDSGATLTEFPPAMAPIPGPDFGTSGMP